MFPYSWNKTEYANPGAMNYAFVPNTLLPAYDMTGGGNLVVDQMRVFQSQQAMMQPTAVTDGYGGLVAGQLIGQPLGGT